MPRFSFTGNSERVFLYPRSFVVRPGDEIDAPENPDPAWFRPVEEEKPSPAEEEE